MTRDIRDPRYARLLARAALANPTTSWWAEAAKKSREEWRADAAEADKRMNACSQNYAQPVKMGDE